MSIAPSSPIQPLPILTGEVPVAPVSADHWMTELHTLLRELEAVTAASHTLPPVFTEEVDSRLVHIRLGVAASLFRALQCKHAATAGHAMRVALTCSAWALKMDLPEAERDAIEVAALLHDVGMIGAPDHILLKAGALDSDEATVIAGTRKMSLDILRCSCTSAQVLEIVENISAWYDGNRQEVPLCGRQIPLGARMIAIVEAFDAMTTDHVYRPARSQERAMAELFECAGTQFDPELVQQFAEFRQADQTADSLGRGPSLVAVAGTGSGRFLLGTEHGPAAGDASPPSTGCSRADCWTTCTMRWCSSTRRAASCCGTAGRNG